MLWNMVQIYDGCRSLILEDDESEKLVLTEHMSASLHFLSFSRHVFIFLSESSASVSVSLLLLMENSFCSKGWTWGSNYSVLIQYFKADDFPLCDWDWPSLGNKRRARITTCLAGKESFTPNVLSSELTSLDSLERLDSFSRHDSADFPCKYVFGPVLNKRQEERQAFARLSLLEGNKAQIHTNCSTPLNLAIMQPVGVFVCSDYSWRQPIVHCFLSVSFANAKLLNCGSSLSVNIR